MAGNGSDEPFPSSLDDMVGALKKGLWDRKAERFRGLEVNNEFENESAVPSVAYLPAYTAPRVES